MATCNLTNGLKICNSLEEVLEALTSAGEERHIDRFSSIVQGLRHNSVQLQVSFIRFVLIAIIFFVSDQ